MFQSSLFSCGDDYCYLSAQSDITQQELLSLTTRTTLYLPVCTLITQAKGYHHVGTSPSSRINTKPPTEIFLMSMPLIIGTIFRQLKYSVDQRFHTWCIRAWHSWKRHRREIDSKETDGSGNMWDYRRSTLVMCWKGYTGVLIHVPAYSM